TSFIAPVPAFADITQPNNSVFTTNVTNPDTLISFETEAGQGYGGQLSGLTVQGNFTPGTSTEAGDPNELIGGVDYFKDKNYTQQLTGECAFKYIFPQSAWGTATSGTFAITDLFENLSNGCTPDPNAYLLVFLFGVAFPEQQFAGTASMNVGSFAAYPFDPSSNNLGVKIPAFTLQGLNYVGTSSVPSISSLTQSQTGNGSTLSLGGSFVGNDVTFSALLTDQTTNPLQMEVEVKPANILFDGTGTTLSTTSTANTTTNLNVTGLIPLDQQYVSGGNVQTFHWRARAVDTVTHATSNWLTFSNTQNDFTAKVVPLWTQRQSPYPSSASSSAWSLDLYASTGGTIGSQGCGIVSIVMIAHYYGIEKDIDGKDITPQSINDWLENNNGYAPGGLIKWQKVAKEYLGIQNPDGIYQQLALSAFRITPAQADAYLANLQPVIARKEAANHFLVVTSKIANTSGGSTYLVRDPNWFNTRTLNDTAGPAVRAYNNSYDYANVFTKLDTPT